MIETWVEMNVSLEVKVKDMRLMDNLFPNIGFKKEAEKMESILYSRNYQNY